MLQHEEWEEAVISMERREEDLLWIMDLNVKVGNGLKGIEGNWEEMAENN